MDQVAAVGGGVLDFRQGQMLGGLDRDKLAISAFQIGRQQFVAGRRR